MDVLNGTRLLAGTTIGVDPDGRERLVVVLKGTFEIPRSGGPAPLASRQEPLVYADTFSGEPGESAMIYESDFAPFKPACDVLLIGSAYAPGNAPATVVPVALRLGEMVKHFEVVGDRHWTSGLLGPTPSAPQPFTRRPISYDVAFGGTEPGLAAYAPNPVGTGSFEKTRDGELLGTPVPSTQELGTPVESPRGRYRPMAFGPMGRNFADRLRHAGTYDEAWFATRFPFLPEDFNFRYFQAAPVDQQIAYPTGGELVQLLNLTPDSIAPFELPRLELPVRFVLADDTEVEQQPKLDTIVLEPDEDRLQLVWRTSLLLRYGVHEVQQVTVGQMSPGWHRARRSGKLYFRSLAELVDADRGG